MTILLGSGGLRIPDRVAVWAEQVRATLSGVGRVLFIPYALADHEGYLRSVIDRGFNAGYALDGLHRFVDPVAAVREAEAIFVGGGNTFRLLSALYRVNLIELIRDRVRAGMPYLGISAGTNVACPTIRTTNDMPIVQPPRLDALGLVPFQINPHYYTGANYVRQGDEFIEHFGETRDDRLREFHEENETPVVGLWEGGLLRVDGGRVDLIGASARVFRRGRPSENVEAGTDLRPLLGPASAA
ncbi:MAG TPA: dipeptidase PepE [Gemmataceae bacterium]|nr:dipeptidase PepE [Gemmataceae bacterium]